MHEHRCGGRRARHRRCFKATGELIGDFSLENLSAEHSVAELGYMLLAVHQGQGLAREACEEVLRLAFEDLGFHRVIARMEVRNVDSAALAERLGMRREAHLVESGWIKGEWQSELIYAMLASEWSERGG